MSFTEKYAIQIVFAIDNNIYLIRNNELLNQLYIMKNKYNKYVHQNDVMNLNIYKIKKAFFDEFFYRNMSPEKRALKNIINTFNQAINDKTDNYFFEELEYDLNILQYYLYFKLL